MSFIINPYRFAAYDADYQSVLNMATALGYTLPSAAHQIKGNQFVLDLKSYGIWTLLDVLYPFATSGDSDFATLNWISPTTYQATKVNSPTFTSSVGFNGNGSTSYLNTTFAPSAGVNYTLNDASFFAYCGTDAAQDNRQLVGAWAAGGVTTAAVQLNPRNATDLGGTRVNQTTGGGNNSTNTNAIGFYHITRTASNARANYKNGTQLDTFTSASSSRPPQSIYLGAANQAGSAVQFRNAIIGCFGAGASLSGNEANLYTAWNTYFTGL